jgi:hypothetical protein
MQKDELQSVLSNLKFNRKEKFPVAGKVIRNMSFYREIWIDCGNNPKQSATISSHMRSSKVFNNFLDKHGAVCGLHIEASGVHKLQVRF